MKSNKASPPDKPRHFLYYILKSDFERSNLSEEKLAVIRRKIRKYIETHKGM